MNEIVDGGSEDPHPGPRDGSRLWRSLESLQNAERNGDIYSVRSMAP